jgi:hypothetical protein
MGPALKKIIQESTSDFIPLPYLELLTYLRTLYIKTTKGYTPEGTGNNKKDIDSSHTIKRNLLLRK